MAHRYRFDIRSAALLAAGVSLLAAPLACQSDAADDGVDVATTVDTFGVGNTAGTAGMASNAGNPPAAAPTNTPSESPAVQNLVPAAPAATPNAEATAMAAGSAAAAPSFEACTYSEGNYGRNCDFVYVSMKQVSPARCVQLTFDNCDRYDRRGLGVDVPTAWLLDSGTVNSNVEECELGVYYPSSSVVLRGSGSVSWNETTRLPSELVLDVTLETSAATGTASIDVTTTAPLAVSDCED